MAYIARMILLSLLCSTIFLKLISLTDPCELQKDQNKLQSNLTSEAEI